MSNIFPFKSPIPDYKLPPFVPVLATVNAIDRDATITANNANKIPPDTSYATSKNLIPPINDIEANTPYGTGGNNQLAVGQLGKKVISWIEFKGAGDDDGPLYITNCIIQVEQKPKIVKTNFIGKDGSVITYIGQDVYQISIEGYVDNKDGIMIYPISDVDNLLKCIASQGTTLGLNIYSPYLNLFDTGIDWIVITNYDFPQEMGGYSQQKFTIEAISDHYNDADAIASPYYL